MGPSTLAGSRSASQRALLRALAVCAAATALFVIVLWPSKVFAAIVPACETDFFSGVVAPPPDPAPDSCADAQNRGDDIDNSRAAPICDSHGASAVAPPRLRGIADVRLDRGRACDGVESARPACSPGRGDPPAQPPEAIFERAVLSALELPVPPGEARSIDPPARTDGPRAGVREDIYHPPR